MPAATTISWVHNNYSIKYIDMKAQGKVVGKNRAALAHIARTRVRLFFPHRFNYYVDAISEKMRWK